MWTQIMTNVYKLLCKIGFHQWKTYSRYDVIGKRNLFVNIEETKQSFCDHCNKYTDKNIIRFSALDNIDKKVT